jgi:hypothetical protein
MRCEDDGDVKTHLTELIWLSQELAAMGSIIADKDLTAITMASLLTSYRSFLQSISASARVVNKSIEPFDLVHWVSEEYELQLKQTHCEKKEDTALYVKAGKGQKGKEKKKKRDVKCFNCHKLGHMIAECWRPGGGKEGQGPHQKKKGSQSNMAATAMEEDENFTFLTTAIESLNLALRCTSEYKDLAAALPDDAEQSKDAILDSGANWHFCPFKGMFTGFRESNTTFKTADGNLLQAEGSGDLRVELPNGSKMMTVMLKNVLYAPTLHFTLILIGTLDDTGCTMTFRNGACEIRSPGKNRQIIAKVPKQGNLYCLHALQPIVNAANATVMKISMSNLHRRMGHIAHQSIQNMIKDEAMTGMQLDKSEPEFCEACTKAKIKRLPLPKKRSDARAVKKYGDRVHSDLWGPAQVSSIGGKNYFVTFTDEATAFSEVEFLKKKSGAFPAYCDLAKAAKTEVFTLAHTSSQTPYGVCEESVRMCGPV